MALTDRPRPPARAETPPLPPRWSGVGNFTGGLGGRLLGTLLQTAQCNSLQARYRLSACLSSRRPFVLNSLPCGTVTLPKLTAGYTGDNPFTLVRAQQGGGVSGGGTLGFRTGGAQDIENFRCVLIALARLHA